MSSLFNVAVHQSITLMIRECGNVVIELTVSACIFQSKYAVYTPMH